ncbi:EF-hand domain-containing protein [Marinovum sp.]|uniref:EF-hand domain-containing protein n=1 Tax=Marinovum sp. TaxID=2024839 RepID=UPI002B2744FA|nr:EF-hand domain-containing protein [Marinovum sp.]
MSKTRNTLILSALVAAIALSVPATSALARGGPGAGGAAGLEFQHFDQNGDGSLTPEEMRDVGKARFAQMDGNGDGELSADELQAAAEARRDARFERMIERLDSDGNGTLSAAELEAGHDKMRKGGKMGRDQARGDKDGGSKERGAQRRADQDSKQGGKRDGAERREARGDARFDQMFALVDTDGNGTVSQAEFDSAKARLATRRAPTAPTEN